MVTSKTLETTPRWLTGVWISKPRRAQKETHHQKEGAGSCSDMERCSQYTDGGIKVKPQKYTMGPLFVNRAKCVCTQPQAFGDPDTPIWRGFFWGERLNVEELSFFFHLHSQIVCVFLTFAITQHEQWLPRIGKDWRRSKGGGRGDDSWVDSFFHG